MKVMVCEERRPSDPLAGENLRRMDLEKRVRIASQAFVTVAGLERALREPGD